MTNRRATAATKGRSPRKRAQTGVRKRASRKTAKKTEARKTTSRKAAADTSSPKKAPAKRGSTRGTQVGKSRAKAQNRRRPAPKKAKPARPKRDWRGWAGGVRERGAAWVSNHGNLFRRVRQGALVLLALGALAAVADQTVRYARTADAFAVREVVVEGNVRLEPMDVRRAAGIQIGSNAFEVSMEEARNRLLQHPWVEDATVVRKLPNRIRVELHERKPVALVALDQLYLVSEEGAVFKRIGVDDPADLPVITGIASEMFYDDFDYRKAVLLRSMAVLQDYEGAGLADDEPVSEIHFDATTGVELFVGDDGMHVRLGRGQHRQKLRRLKQVLARLSREKARPAYVYLDNVRSPERVTVRLQ